MKTFSILLNSFILFNFLTISIVGMTSTVQSQAPVFLSVIDDFPLMPGLRENFDGALSFDTANGRIAEIAASGTVEAGAVIDYYARTLPQLGWKLEPLDTYVREDEVLNIIIESINGDSTQVIVHFRLSPAGKK
jgi:hypothetical protein